MRFKSSNRGWSALVDDFRIWLLLSASHTEPESILQQETESAKTGQILGIECLFLSLDEFFGEQVGFQREIVGGSTSPMSVAARDCLM